MARDFVPASNQKLEVSNVPATAVPLTLSALFYPDDTTTSKTLVGLFTGGSDLHKYSLRAGNDAKVWALVNNGGPNVQAKSTTTYSAGAWSHACGVFTSATSRDAYLAGGGKGSDTSNSTAVSFNRTTIGKESNANTVNMDGRIAEVGIWAAALNADEIAALAKGISPALIRPDALVFYAPIIGRYSPEIDLVGGLHLTVTGATVIEHPRVYYPRRRALAYYQQAQNLSQSVGGTLGLAGALAKRPSKPLSGLITTAGSLARRASKPLSGSLTPAGALIRAARKSLAGSLTPAGALIRRAGKVTAGALSPSGALSRSVRRALSGALTPAGSLARRAAVAFSGALGLSGLLSKRGGKALSGDLTPAGGLRRDARKALSGDLQPAGGLTKRVGKALSGLLTWAGALVSLYFPPSANGDAHAREVMYGIRPRLTAHETQGRLSAGRIDLRAVTAQAQARAATGTARLREVIA